MPPSQEECAKLPLLKLSFLLQASKATAYRRNILALGQAVANVLSKEMLVQQDLRPRFEADPNSFVIKLGELTPEGFEFCCARFDKWLGKIDRWKTERTVEKLEHALQQEILSYRAR